MMGGMVETLDEGVRVRVGGRMTGRRLQQLLRKYKLHLSIFLFSHMVSLAM